MAGVSPRTWLYKVLDIWQKLLAFPFYREMRLCMVKG